MGRHKIKDLAVPGGGGGGRSTCGGGLRSGYQAGMKTAMKDARANQNMCASMKSTMMGKMPHGSSTGFHMLLVAVYDPVARFLSPNLPLTRSAPVQVHSPCPAARCSNYCRCCVREGLLLTQEDLAPQLVQRRRSTAGSLASGPRELNDTLLHSAPSVATWSADAVVPDPAAIGKHSDLFRPRESCGGLSQKSSVRKDVGGSLGRPFR